MPINMTDYRMIINERVYNVLQIMIGMGYEEKERQQAAGENAVDVQDG